MDAPAELAGRKAALEAELRTERRLERRHREAALSAKRELSELARFAAAAGYEFIIETAESQEG